MARLAAQAQAEFYPTPLSVVDLIVRHLEIRPGKHRLYRIFDPCVGDGKAVAHLAQQLQQQTPDLDNDDLQTWGVELHPGRAAEAAERLDEVIEATFEVINWKPSHGLANVLYLNPPYDWSEASRGSRMETYFLNRATQALVPGGTLIYIIPVSAVWDYNLCRALYTNYENLALTRFPDDTYERFKQLVIFGTRREQHIHSHYQMYEQINALRNYAPHAYHRERNDPLDLPEVGRADLRRYTVKPISSYQATFFRFRWQDAEIKGMVDMPDLPVLPEQEMRDKGPIEVLLSPKKGHLAQMLAAGLMGTLELPGEVIKGRSVKRTEVHHETTESTEKEIHTTRWEAHLIRVTRSGVETYEDAGALPFLEDHAQRLAALLEDKIDPYGYETTDEEQTHIAKLSPRPRPGGGQGLYDNQQETVTAALRALERYNVAHIVGEMGYGKTTVASAVADVGNMYPAFVMCPPHLVNKWEREFKAVVPDAKPVVVEHLSDLRAAIRRHRSGEKLVVIAAWSTVSQGPGWYRTVNRRHTLPVYDDREAQTLHRAGFRAALRTYRQGQTQLKAARHNGHTPDELAELRRQVANLRDKALKASRSYPVCPDCGKPLENLGKSRSTLHCDCEVDYPRVETFMVGEAADADNDNEEAAEQYGDDPLCYAPLFTYRPKVTRRWPLADYISRHAPDIFKLLIVDECHQYKAGASDRGTAYGRLSDTIGPTLNLTGTFYGGVASSIFYLLYRSQPDIREAWEYSDERRWIETFGRIQKTYSTSITTGKHSARKKRRVNTKEIPGISPTVLRHILKTAIFRSVADLGIALPPYRDEVVRLDMNPAQAQDYECVCNFTWDQVVEWRQRYLSSWLQWTLARPNSAFRREVVEGLTIDEVTKKPKTLVAPPVPAEGELLPKEAWLLNKAQNELAEGRRMIIYLRQTGTRDIRDRLLQLLTAAGLNAQNLPDSLAPKRREAWLEKHHPDILITNPRRVETGLDLVMYHTAIFYEIEYSLYTVWQACRRIWRPGQTKPVKVYYVVYKDTMEDRAIRLIGKKMAAGQMLYGDDVAGALVDDTDAGFVTELMRAIEDEEDLEAVAAIFGKDDGTTDSAVGSPTRTSPPLRNPFVAWLHERGYASRAEVVTMYRRRRNHVKAPEQQLALALEV